MTKIVKIEAERTADAYWCNVLTDEEGNTHTLTERHASAIAALKAQATIISQAAYEQPTEAEIIEQIKETSKPSLPLSHEKIRTNHVMPVVHKDTLDPLIDEQFVEIAESFGVAVAFGLKINSLERLCKVYPNEEKYQVLLANTRRERNEWLTRGK